MKCRTKQSENSPMVACVGGGGYTQRETNTSSIKIRQVISGCTAAATSNKFLLGKITLNHLHSCKFNFWSKKILDAGCDLCELYGTPEMMNLLYHPYHVVSRGSVPWCYIITGITHSQKKKIKWSLNCNECVEKITNVVTTTNVKVGTWRQNWKWWGNGAKLDNHRHHHSALLGRIFYCNELQTTSTYYKQISFVSSPDFPSNRQ